MKNNFLLNIYILKLKSVSFVMCAISIKLVCVIIIPVATVAKPRSWVRFHGPMHALIKCIP